MGKNQQDAITNDKKPTRIKDIIKVIRPHQWIKNVFIFLPLFFDRHLFDIDYIVPTFFAFVAFSFAASGIYCLNDILDVEADRLHPTKRNRPIASGRISRIGGYVMMLLCWVVSLLVSIVCIHITHKLFMSVFGIIAFYIMLNIGYCIYLKRIAIVDVFVVSINFVLRVMLGCSVTGIYLSHWIVLMTFLLALFLAFSKRRDDVLIYNSQGLSMRKNVARYNIDYINQIIAVVSTITMICYIMYTVSPDVTERFGSDYVYLTSIFVLAGIIRYLQLTIVDCRSGSPTKIMLTDRFIQASVVAWVLSFFIIIYFQ